ncbi:MAG: hypothetical protein IGR76_07690 [Synechococcales cyanobacterium T60_A2020_003]|nr:hypothetical protein [Synechococcales cyanobacterium T60_A2020_003]
MIGNDVIDGGEGRDTINGGHGNDRLFGWFDNDTLIGEKGNDELYGESGDDVLEGGIGNDILDGGTGKNTLSTGDGNDIIVVDKKGLSVVRDFELGSDRLQLTQNLTYGALTFKQKGSDTLIQFNGKTVTILEDVNRSDLSSADFL